MAINETNSIIENFAKFISKSVPSIKWKRVDQFGGTEGDGEKADYKFLEFKDLKEEIKNLDIQEFYNYRDDLFPFFEAVADEFGKPVQHKSIKVIDDSEANYLYINPIRRIRSFGEARVNRDVNGRLRAGIQDSFNY